MFDVLKQISYRHKSESIENNGVVRFHKYSSYYL